ncbi:uncharacterized protein LOC141631789 [Silene latifolia]|uniref:uncharacterized protein LOC141631789 n=1 Tax=Silene latifolia TaxID=37657 RepID=UPI003D783CC4
MAEDSQIPIILGRPLFHTARAIIDVKNGRLTLEVGNEKVTFNLTNALKIPMMEESCYFIDIVDKIVEDTWPGSLHRDLFEAFMCLDSCAGDPKVNDAIVDVLEVALEGRELNPKESKLVSDLVQPVCTTEVCKPELKPLPSNLKYAFLDETESFPVIGNANLSESQLAELLAILRRNKNALRYSLDDLTDDQEKTTFTCPSGVFAYRRMSFGLCNTPATFQRCMMGIFSEYLESIMEVFMDDFSVYGTDFSSCLLNLEKKKCHFMVTEGVVLGHIISAKGIQVDRAKVQDKALHAIYYAIKTLDEAQVNYATTEKELLAIVFALEKFRSYLVGSEIRHKKGAENVVADHLLRLRYDDKDVIPIDDSFPDGSLMHISSTKEPWFADYANYIVGQRLRPDMSYQHKKRFLHDVRYYFWDDPYLFCSYADVIYHRCIPQWEVNGILDRCHSSPYGGHHGASKTTAKVLQSGFYWPTIFRDAHTFVTTCDACQRTVELEYRAYWAIKELNFDPSLAKEKRLLQLNELDEFRLSAYESSRMYKEHKKRWHDMKILPREFSVGEKVLLFNSRLKIFPGKLKSRWSGPYTVTMVNKFGSVEVESANGDRFKVNGQRLKCNTPYL